MLNVGSAGASSVAVHAGFGTFAGLGVQRKSKAVSIIMPVFNEAGNIAICCEKLSQVLEGLALDYEVIAVNDGSKDHSLQELLEQAERYPRLKVVDLHRNYGQTAAIMAGIDHAVGEIVIMIDADLQNDPEDIPALLAKLEEGYDVVSGWRKDRQDEAIRRNLVSRLANRLISRVSGVPLNDYGCTLKAYRREILNGMRLYGEMHRFIPIYASWMGAKITELPVRHHPRRIGQSKYGLERVVKVVLDLIVVKFLDRHFVKPIYVFGGFGVFSFVLCCISTLYMLYLKFIEGTSFILTPLPLISAMTFLVGFLSILMGLLAEMLVRTYFESQQRTAYTVRKLINFGDPV
jgi:glycosyltransferase involved in cell wall biosynthesis